LSVAVVSGGNRGIGLAVVRDLAQRGFSVIQGARDPGSAPASDGDVRAVRLDVTDPGDIAALAAQLDRVDVLVNNAAISYDTWNRAVTTDLAFIRAALETNLFGAWALSQALLPQLRASGHGRIVNVSSGAGSLASMSGGTPAYQVSKAALNAFTRTLAGELLPDDGPTGGFFRDGRPVPW
jgi:NAD(P)-dependent dehydrogenase (short-subunit alcohol dehydrogenase family)